LTTGAGRWRAEGFLSSFVVRRCDQGVGEGAQDEALCHGGGRGAMLGGLDAEDGDGEGGDYGVAVGF